uniref:PHD-type domain-containing protein n=1 Tax=Aureoumbra lagunensis TaxID=44058 RepID=A0A7S3JVH9_9STRA
MDGADKVQPLELWNKLAPEVKEACENKTCRKAGIMEKIGTLCPECLKPARQRNRCQLRSGVWPEEKISHDRVLRPTTILSPQRQGSLISNMVTDERRAVKRPTEWKPSPSGFRDKRCPDRRRRKSVAPREQSDQDSFHMEFIRNVESLNDEKLKLLSRLALAMDGHTHITKGLDENEAKLLQSLLALEDSHDDDDDDDEEEEEEDDDDDKNRLTLSEICRAVLPKDELRKIQSILRKAPDTIGARRATVASIEYDRKRQLQKIVAFLVNHICRIAKAGEQDSKGVWDLLLNDRSVQRKEQANILDHPLVANVVQAYRVAKRTKKIRAARQMLSLLVTLPGVTYDQLIEVCSDSVDFSIDMIVRVRVNDDRTYRIGKIVQVNDSCDDEKEDDFKDERSITYDVEYFTLDRSTTDRRFVSLGQQANAISSCIENKTANGVDFYVPAERIRSIDAVNTSRDEIYKAKLHALAYYPGAELGRVVFSRPGRFDAQRAEYLATYLRPGGTGGVELADASNRNVQRGIRYMRTDTVSNMYKRLNEQLKKLNLRPLSKGLFFFHAATKDTVDAKAETCVCRTCRDLGYHTFDDIIELLDDIDALITKLKVDHRINVEGDIAGLMEKLKKRSDALHRFLRVVYKTELKEQHHDPRLCIQFALTTAADPRFKQNCTHTRLDGTIGAEPETFEQFVQSQEGRQPIADDWNDCCEYCNGSGKLILCGGCNVAAHVRCIKKSLNDFDPATFVDEDGDEEMDNLEPSNTGWRCPPCQNEYDQCRHSCHAENVNEKDWFFSDIRNLIERCIPASSYALSHDNNNCDTTTITESRQTSAITNPRIVATASNDANSSAICDGPASRVNSGRGRGRGRGRRGRGRGRGRSSATASDTGGQRRSSRASKVPCYTDSDGEENLNNEEENDEGVAHPPRKKNLHTYHQLYLNQNIQGNCLCNDATLTTIVIFKFNCLSLVLYVLM